VPTRLGEDDRRVRFEPGFLGPFGLHVEELAIRETWCRGVPDEAEVASNVMTESGTTLFVFGDRQFVYDRHGLRRASRKSGENIDDTRVDDDAA